MRANAILAARTFPLKVMRAAALKSYPMPTDASRRLVAQATRRHRYRGHVAPGAAASYKQAYTADGQLYFTMLRSFATLNNVVGPNTRLILRTDAAPFRVLVDQPGDTAQPRPRRKH